MVAVDEILQRIRTGAEIFVVVAHFAGFADHTDRETAAAPALADAGVENGGFKARVGADDEERVCFFDALNGRVEEVACAAERRIKCRPILATVEVLGTERLYQFGQSVHFFDRGEVAGNRADLLAGRASHCRLDGAEGFGPGCRLQAAALADVRTIEALRLQAVPDEAALVGDPLFVDLVVDARHA